MSKINQIQISNLKAISSATATFNGCTAIITGGNDKGKTTLARAIIDRIRGIKPDIILKHEEHEGFCKLTLTDNSQFIWSFDDKTKAGEKLVYITDKGIKTNATREICDRYFPSTFDVDEFLQDTPMTKRKKLQKLVGLDFTDIDARYDVAFKERTSRNATVTNAKARFDSTPVPEQVEKIDIAEIEGRIKEEKLRLNELYLSNKAYNEEVKAAYQKRVDECKKVWQDYNTNASENARLHNEAQTTIENKIKDIEEAEDLLRRAGYENIGAIENFRQEVINQCKPRIIYKWNDFVAPEEPIYIEVLPSRTILDIIEEELKGAHETNRKADVYTTWENLRKEYDAAVQQAKEADAVVKGIEKERMDLIKSAKMPEGFTFSEDGILFNGLPFNRQQLSSSGVYIAALKLAAMTLGEVKTIHFDASFLDMPRLNEIQHWAEAEGLQLLIEMPDRAGGDITYEIIEK